MNNDSQALTVLERVQQYAMPHGPVACHGFDLRQSGEIRMAPDKPWLRFRAEQWLDAAGLDFRWTARARMARILPVTVVDAFEGGHGLLSVRIAGIVPVARAEGPEVDRGEVLRALAELPWRPTAFSSGSHAPQITWSVSSPGKRAPDSLALDSRAFGTPAMDTLRASFDDGATRCFVDFEVDAEGRVLSAGAPDRPCGAGKTFVATPWRGTFDDYATFNGLRVPARAEVSWLLPEGAFTYFRGRITDFRAVR